MRKQITMTLALAMLLPGVLVIPAWPADAKSAHETTADQGPSPAGIGQRRHRVRQAMRRRFAQRLCLTDVQRAEIRSIIDTERANLLPLRQEVATHRRELNKVTESGRFDETQVRAVAEKQAKALSELMVARARVRSKIHAVLTPEQQRKAEELRERRLELLRGGMLG